MNRHSLLATLLFLLLVGCVRPKIYRTETANRQSAEARESVMRSELADRKREAAELINRVAELSKTTGSQETEITRLKQEASQKSQLSSESVTRLQADNQRLTTDLAEKTKSLAARQAHLDKIGAAQNRRVKAIQTIQDSLAIGLNRIGLAVVSFEVRDEKLVLSLPDSLLFDDKGLTVSASGLPALQVVGQFLSQRPTLPVSIIAYTDNIFPKEKGLTLRDSWDWSLLRANVVGRVLSRENNVNDNQLSFVGRGEFYPVASNETPEGRAENRRTELVFSPKLDLIPSAKE